MIDVSDLVDGVQAGDQRAVARAISVVEDRRPGYRDLVAALYRSPGDAHVLGVTGSPGVGKSTLVDALVSAYRERGDTVGVLAIDPASPFSGGALLGDRVRMRGAADDDGVFVRSMSSRGETGGLAAAALDAVRVLSAADSDVVIVETVGAGQTEVDLVGAADTVLLLLQPATGDDVQALKAGIVETGDVFVVNKADRPGADRTVRDLREMVEASDRLGSIRLDTDSAESEWTPPVVETVATDGDGLDELLAAVDDHWAFLADSRLDEHVDRRRSAEAIRTHLRAAIEEAVDREVEAAGGMDALVDEVIAREADPHAVADRLLDAVGDAPVEPTPGDDS